MATGATPIVFLQKLPMRIPGAALLLVVWVVCAEDYPEDRPVGEVQAAILRHLKWPEAPPVGGPRPPSHLARHFQERWKRPQVLAVPRNKNFACSEDRGRDCSRFVFEVSPSHGEVVTSVQVWFRKRRPSSRLSLSVLTRPSDSGALQWYKVVYEELSSNVTEEGGGWVGFDLQVDDAALKGDGVSCAVKVSGGRVMRTGHDGPYLVASRSPLTGGRRRRSSAGPGCDCRAVDRVLTASELQWEHWIIAPADLNVRACRGTCLPAQSSFNVTYGNLMHNLVKGNPALQASTLEEFWLPRCVPTKMSDLSIIYVPNKTGEIVETDVKDLVIEECACLANNCHRN